MNYKNNQFYPQLDSLRAIAVLLVIISHWFAQEHFLNRYSANGILGVTLFFVLSGFLITGILLKSKTKVEEGGLTSKTFKVFYIRRSLRIFPIYYLMLFLLLVFNLASVRDSFWWHLFYSTNFYFWIKGAFAGSLSHLWSLAVEEQFYLVWPAVILLTPRRHLTTILLTGVATGLLFRLGMVTNESDMIRFLMPGSIDSFCIGGLLALGRTVEMKWYKLYMQRQTLFLLFAFLLFVTVHLPFFKSLPAALHAALYLLFISITFGIVINRVANTVEAPLLKQLLNNKALLYIGKISYGVYLFHNFIPYFYTLTVPGFPATLSPYLTQLLRFVLLVAIASFSWFIIEKPILHLKKYFQYA